MVGSQENCSLSTEQVSLLRYIQNQENCSLSTEQVSLRLVPLELIALHPKSSI